MQPSRAEPADGGAGRAAPPPRVGFRGGPDPETLPPSKPRPGERRRRGGRGPAEPGLGEAGWSPAPRSGRAGRAEPLPGGSLRRGPRLRRPGKEEEAGRGRGGRDTGRDFARHDSRRRVGEREGLEQEKGVESGGLGIKKPRKGSREMGGG